MNTPLTLVHARHLDHEDPLREFRQRFVFPEKPVIYLDGNSLGMLPKETVTHLQHVIGKEWGQELIGSWNDRWFILNETLGKRIAGLVGAGAAEVILSDATSVNLYKLAWGALQLLPQRHTIVTDVFNFPSDHYILQGLANAHTPRRKILIAPSDDGIHINVEKLARLITQDTALVCLSLVAYQNAFMYDLAEITRLAHQQGALILWDLSHAIGAVPIDLKGAHADLAVGCTYKYLNGGPGSPAFLFVRKDLQKKLPSPVWGWMGSKVPFEFSQEYEAPANIRRYLTGSPPILSMTTLEGSLGLLEEAGITRIREKSVQQTEFLLDLAQQWLIPLGFAIASPTDPGKRGSHVSLQHPEAYRITQALIHPEKGAIKVVPDFRSPDLVRLGITPLYTSYRDIYHALSRIKEIIASGIYRHFSENRQSVT